MKNVWVWLLVIIAGCSKVPTPAESEATPAWLQTKIESFKTLPEANPPRSISKTTFKGEIVYYVSSACCDIPSELYNADGTLLCYPSGGIAGGDGRCPAFSLDRQRMKAVWKDERSTYNAGSSPAER
jgi:hypothetical protein